MRDDSDVPNAVAAAFLIEIGLHVSPEDVLGVAIWRRTFLHYAQSMYSYIVVDVLAKLIEKGLPYRNITVVSIVVVSVENENCVSELFGAPNVW